jgi:large subunit ribosomal protein L7/L12
VEQTVVAAAPGGAAAPGAAAEAEAPKVEEKTEFNVRLSTYAAGDKIKVIKEVRAITGLGLKQAKDLVESAEQGAAIIKKGCPKDEAVSLQEKLKAAGAESVLE